MSSKPTMECVQFRCWRHGDRRCCAGCQEPCDHICYNGPERCGLSFDPAAQEAEDCRQIREALEAGQSIEAISRHLGRSSTYVKYRARKMGLV